MKLDDFNYELPPQLIAQKPADRRDESRLMVLHRESGKLEHRLFCHITDYLDPGDTLVLNRTRVIPARLTGERKGTGGRMELLLLREKEQGIWEVMAKPGRRARPGEIILFGDGDLRAEIISTTDSGNRVARFSSDGDLAQAMQRHGRIPLPPYITRYHGDAERYQTVYAAEDGSAAAPTAGLHFTHELLRKIEDSGVRTASLLLHVGQGTFQPVKTENIEDHVMHSEFCILPAETAGKLNATRRAGKRIICVGTTSCRTLETAADTNGTIHPFEGETDIFIYPGYKFKATDALLTNFHLPKSSLLMLVSAFAGREWILEAYREAVAQRYRFFSFGDAMLIL